jgi:glycosyltransferase involved in cell wall biosynthesis
MTTYAMRSSAVRAVEIPVTPPRVSHRYLLLTFIPYYVDEQGALWLTRLWHRDFLEHMRYLRRIALAAPAHGLPREGEDLVKVAVPEGVELTLVPLPRMESTREAIAKMPEVARILWRAIGETEIVHSGVAGWPIPVGWVGNSIALARHKKLVIMVESAPWRLSGANGETRRDRLRELVTEALARFFVRRADVNLFTQPDYRRTLARADGRGCFVTPATWINEEDIASASEARASWASKRTEPVRLLFAARLTSTKGVDVLLSALEHLDAEKKPVLVDVIGDGPRRNACELEVGRLDHVRLRVLSPVEYGAPFFSLLRRYHAALVPSLGDEQPRIVFDAFAQAVPVIASDTDGLRPHVADGETGYLVERGDLIALAAAIARATESPAELERLGMNALARAPRFTHRGMHEERWRILVDAFGPG